MKNVVAAAVSSLITIFIIASLTESATAQQLDTQNSAYWQLIRAQNPYFNKAGSTLPQRYTLTPSSTVSRPARAMTAPQPVPSQTTLVQFTPTQSTSSQSTLSQTGHETDRALWGYISEARVGLLSHDVRFPSRHKFHAPNPFENRYESGVNINPEVVFTSPDWLEWMWEPRPHVGVSINTSGDTSSIYTGLGWDTAWDNGVFLDGFFGLAGHDGELRDGNPKGKIEFGSWAVFRLGGEVGWRWDDNQGVGLLWEHMSNGGIMSGKNQGIDSLGLRYSYRFDTPK